MALTPVLARRRLGTELKTLREAAKVSVKAAAEQLECSTAKISRLENGKGVPYRRDVRDLLDLYGVADEFVIDQALEWAEIGQTRAWWDKFGDLRRTDPSLERLIQLESSASRSLSYHSNLVPALAQTEGYARAVLRALNPRVTDAALEEKVRIRLERQQVLTRKPKPLYMTAVLDEGILRRPIGDHAIMREQLEAIRSAVEDPNSPITIRVLPFEAGGHEGLAGSFRIFDFADDADQDVVIIEHVNGSVILEVAEDVIQYRSIFDGIRQKSWNQSDTVKQLGEAIDRLSV